MIAGWVFLVRGEDSGPVRDGLAGISKTLPAEWAQRAQALSETLQEASEALAAAKERAARREPEPILSASVARWLGWPLASDAEVGFAPKSEPKSKPRFEPKAEPRSEPEATPEEVAHSKAPLKWLLEDAPWAENGSFLLSGANVSDQPLEAVRAVLKPDSGADTLTLTVNVAGQADGAVPPGAQFNLSAPVLTADQATQFGGAILSFAYSHEGRRRTSIMYLTPTMLAKRATSAPITDR